MPPDCTVESLADRLANVGSDMVSLDIVYTLFITKLAEIMRFIYIYPCAKVILCVSRSWAHNLHGCKMCVALAITNTHGQINT